MFLTPDTTAQLVADRRRAFESSARLRRRHRSTPTTPTTTVAGTPSPVPARVPSATDRTSVAEAPRAA